MVSIGYKVRCAMGKQLGYISPTCFQQAPHYEVQNKVRHMTEEGRGTYCREGKRGNGAEKGKGKPEGRGRGGAEETCGGAPSQTARPKGSSPQGMSGAITKSELHSPEEQRDLVIVRSDPKAREHFEKSCFLASPKGIFGKQCFCQFQWPRASVWAIVSCRLHPPLWIGKSPLGFGSKVVAFLVPS